MTSPNQRLRDERRMAQLTERANRFGQKALDARQSHQDRQQRLAALETERRQAHGEHRRRDPADLIATNLVMFGWLVVLAFVDFALFSASTEFLILMAFFNLLPGAVPFLRLGLSVGVVLLDVVFAVKRSLAKDNGDTRAVVMYTLAALALAGLVMVLTYIAAQATISLEIITGGSDITPIVLALFGGALHFSAIFAGDQLRNAFAWALHAFRVLWGRLGSWNAKRRERKAWRRSRKAYSAQDRLDRPYRKQGAALPSVPLDRNVQNLFSGLTGTDNRPVNSDHHPQQEEEDGLVSAEEWFAFPSDPKPAAESPRGQQQETGHGPQ